MSVFVWLLILIIGCYCRRQPSMLQIDIAAEFCMEKYNATFEDFEKILDFIAPSTRTTSCLYACFYKELGIINSINEIKVTLLEELQIPDFGKNINKKELIEIYKSCADILKPSMEFCESANIFVTCSHDKIMDVRRWALRE